MTDLDHKAFLGTLTPETRKALIVRSNLAGIRHLLAHWGLILLIGALILSRIPFWPALVPIQGILIIFNFTLLHECTHKTPFRSNRLNEIIGWIAGILVGLPFIWFRYFHLVHHKFTNDPDRDPELQGITKPTDWPSYVWRVSGIPIWFEQGSGLIKIAIGQDSLQYVPKSKHRMVRLESGLIVILYSFIGFYSFFASSSLLMTWILPAIIGQPFLRLYLMAEHGRCPVVANMLENSRTTYTNIAVRFLAWNMPYHAEHHVQPNVPFYLLPKLNHLIKAHLRVTENGYSRFHASYVKSGFSGSEPR